MFSSDDNIDDQDSSEGEELLTTMSLAESEKDRLISKPRSSRSSRAATSRATSVLLQRESSTEIEETTSEGVPIKALRAFSPTRTRVEGGASINMHNRSSSSIIYKTEHFQRSTVYEWLLTSFAAVGGFLFGYDTGVVSGAMLLLRKEFSLSSFWQEVIVSVTIGLAFLSALAGGPLNDLFGRRIVTIIASFVFTVGAVILGMANNVSMLVVGRGILGIGIGKNYFFNNFIYRVFLNH